MRLRGVERMDLAVWSNTLSRVLTLSAIALTLVSLGGPVRAEPLPGLRDLDVEACVALALRQNATIEQAEAEVDVYRARLREVESIFYPKLQGLAFLAPMYTVDANFTDSGVESFDVRWQSIRDWGPYANFEAVLTQVVYTFGRAAAGQRAAEYRIEVERARVREARNLVAQEIRRLYFSYMFTQSVRPALEQAREVLMGAIAKGQETYDSASGEVTFADLSRLRFAQIEVDKLDVLLETASQVLLSALKHTMGLPDSVTMTFAETRLPRIEDELPPELPVLVQRAMDNRPEWKQLSAGQAALEALEEAELKANLPALGIAGQVEASWTPTRTNNINPYLRDPYNEFSGGLALALLFDLDPEKSLAKADAARAQKAGLAALERFATTGIPLQVKQARADLIRFKRVAELSQNGIKVTRKWLTFAASGYETGATTARDLLEGLAAYIESKRSYYDGLRSYHIAEAELRFALGEQ